MKKLTLLLLLVCQFTFAQTFNVSDLYVEPVAVKNSLTIYHFTPENNLCDSEFHYLTGDNKMLAATVSIMNLGPNSAIFDIADVGCNYIYHSCHGHMHIPLMTLDLLDPCGFVVKTSNKIGFNMSGSYSWPYLNYGYQGIIRSATPDEWNAITQFGTPDSSLALVPYDPLSNGEDHQVIEAGKGDTYDWSYAGNGIIINGVSDGYYSFRVTIEPPHCDINEGNNIYPNVVVVPIQIQGDVVTTLNQLPSQPTPSDPTTVTASGRNISWSASTNACYYIVQRYLIVRGNGEQESGLPVTVTTTTYTDNTAVSRNSYLWRVTAVNPSGTSTDVPSNKVRINR